MTLIQLECFLRTAESGSFTKAAEALFISRQVVSAHVRTLEMELGYPLFHRGSRNISLTESGSVLFQKLSALEAQFHQALEDARERRDHVELSVGACEMSDDWDWRLYDFTEKHPHCHLKVEALPLCALESGLLNGRFDMIISLYDDLSDASPTSYIIERLRPLQTVIAVSKKHPLARREHLDVPDLDGERLYAISPDYSAKSLPLILGRFAHDGAQPREVKLFSNYKSLELALANDGVCIAFDIFLANRGDRLKLFPIRQIPGVPVEQLAMAYRRDGGPMVKALAAFLRESGL